MGQKFKRTITNIHVTGKRFIVAYTTEKKLGQAPKLL